MTENQQHAEQVIRGKARRDWLLYGLILVIVLLLGYIVVSYYLAQRQAAEAVANAKTLAQQVAEACEDEAVIVSDQNICDQAAQVAQIPTSPSPGLVPQQPTPAITLRGQDGRDGEDGRDGVDGEDGRPGADGKAGADGRAGASGDDGEPGADGATGGQGAQGEPGPPPTAEEISAAVATYCGQASQPCKGDKGDTGDTGPAGPGASMEQIAAAVQAYCSMPGSPCSAPVTPTDPPIIPE